MRTPGSRGLRSQEMPVEEAVNLFAANRHWMSRVLRGCTETDFGRAGQHTEHGRMTLAELVDHLYHPSRPPPALPLRQDEPTWERPCSRATPTRSSDGRCRIWCDNKEPERVTRLFAGTPWDRPPTCDRCGKPESECACPPPVVEPIRLAPASQTARLGTREAGQGQDRHGHRLARSRRQRPARSGGPAQGLLRHRGDRQGRPDRAPGRPPPGASLPPCSAGLQDQTHVDPPFLGSNGSSESSPRCLCTQCR